MFFARLGQRIIHYLTTATAEGTLYELDFRLRPSGAKGLRVNGIEALREELRAFVRCIRTGEPPLTPGEDGVRVAQVLEAAQRSLDEGGREVRLRIR